MGRPSIETDRARAPSRLRQAMVPVLAAVIPPIIVYAVERLVGAAVPRLLLFNAAVIASSWVGGLAAGLAATILSTGLAWSLMVPAFGPVDSRFYVAAAMFAAVGIGISVFHARLKRATREAADALAKSQRATADLTRLRWDLESANVRLQRTTDDLNKSKGLLQAVFDHTPTVIVVKDLEGKFLLTNRRFEEFVGISHEQSPGITDYDVLPPAAADRHRAIDADAIKAGGPIKTEESGEVNGMTLTFLETVFPLRDAVGNMFGVCWLGTEISDIKRAEEALARTAADLKEAQRVAHIGSWIFDVATEKLEWSEELYRIHGLDPSAPPPSYRQDFPKLFTPESMKALRESLERVERDRAPYELDLEAILPNGSTRWVSARAEPMIDANGRLVAVRGTSQDITQLKQLQRMKEEWMSIIAHDLRQPIGVIKMSAQMLPDFHRGTISAEEGVLGERIQLAAKGLARMVDDLLDMSRIEAHRLSLERSWVEPLAMVRQTVAGLAHITASSPVRITDDGIPSQVHVDLVRFEQILGNLLSNAIKHGEKGKEIRVHVARHDGEAEISVSNHGKGIAPADVPRLFSRFGRASSSEGAAVPGLGLGLYIAKGLVEAHGGRIWVDSVPGGITTFHFTLPGRATSKEVAA
jgi:PAS domain S-box-containing protein